MGFMDELKKLARPYAEDDEDDYDDYDNDDFEDEEDEAPKPRPAPAALPRPSATPESRSAAESRRGGKVVNMHTTAQLQVVLVKPERFDNVSEIAEHLRERRAVVLNLESAPIRTLPAAWSISSPAAPTRWTARSRRSPSPPTSSRLYNVDIVGDLVEELENNGMYF